MRTNAVNEKDIMIKAITAKLNKLDLKNIEYVYYFARGLERGIERKSEDKSTVSA